MLNIINGESRISLRIVDWFATNYSKKYYTVYLLKDSYGAEKRFKVYIDYKLKLNNHECLQGMRVLHGLVLLDLKYRDIFHSKIHDFD